MPSRKMKRKITRLAGRMGRKTRRVGRKYKVGKKITRFGPGIAGAGLTAAGIVGSLATGSPIPLMAGVTAAGGLKSLATDMKEARRRPAMVHRNHSSTSVAVAPTGSRTR